jgi:hypothetical protein
VHSLWGIFDREIEHHDHHQTVMSACGYVDEDFADVRLLSVAKVVRACLKTTSLVSREPNDRAHNSETGREGPLLKLYNCF